MTDQVPSEVDTEMEWDNIPVPEWVNDFGDNPIRNTATFLAKFSTTDNGKKTKVHLRPGYNVEEKPKLVFTPASAPPNPKQMDQTAWVIGGIIFEEEVNQRKRLDGIDNKVFIDDQEKHLSKIWHDISPYIDDSSFMKKVGARVNTLFTNYEDQKLFDRVKMLRPGDISVLQRSTSI